MADEGEASAEQRLADQCLVRIHFVEQLLEDPSRVQLGGAEAIVIQLDTPGGLDLAMRDIIKECLNATVPVVVYVSPSGAMAASAFWQLAMATRGAFLAPASDWP